MSCAWRTARQLPTSTEVLMPETETPVLELSVVMPCLNEVDTLANASHKARRAMCEHGIVGEVIVADNAARTAPKASQQHSAPVSSTCPNVGMTHVIPG